MNRRRLGKSAITVTDICLGTMTFGEQADEATSFAIMDRAYDAGVNFFDIAMNAFESTALRTPFLPDSITTYLRALLPITAPSPPRPA